MFMSKKLHKAIVAELTTRIAALREEVGACKAQLLQLEAAAKYERTRTDQAVDRLLAASGNAPLAPAQHNIQEFDGLFEEDPAVVRNIRSAINNKGAEVVLLEPEES